MRIGSAGLLILLLAAHLFFANEFRAFPNANVRSRVYLTLAMAERYALSIDECVKHFGRTQDMAEAGGHLYSDKPPGYSALLVPLAWALRRAGVAADDMRGLSIGLRVLGLSLPAVVFWFVLRRHYGRLAGSDERGCAVVLAGALGTCFFIYATHLFAHVAAAILLFMAYRLVLGATGPGRAAAAAGLLALAWTIDFVVLPAIGIIGWELLVRRGAGRGRRAVAMAAAALPVLVAWMAYNNACFGSPLDVGFRHHVDPAYRAAYQRGLWGIQPPAPAALPGLTILPSRGLLFMSPFLLLAPVGWARMRRDPARRTAATLSAAASVSILLFATTTVDWRGGWSAGARYLVPTIPFLLEGVAAALARPMGRWTAGLFAAGATAGIVQTSLLAATFPHLPFEFHDPFFQMAVPLLTGGHVGGTLWHSAVSVAEVLPFGMASLVAIWMVVRAVRLGSPAARRASFVLWMALAVTSLARLWIDLHPSYQIRLARADVMADMGYTCDADAARLLLHEQTAQFDPRNAYEWREIGRIRASSPCGGLRDGARAVIAARHAVELTAHQDARCLAVLALAHAEEGRFDEALRAIDQAESLSISTADGLVEELARYRRLFHENRRWHAADPGR